MTAKDVNYSQASSATDAKSCWVLPWVLHSFTQHVYWAATMPCVHNHIGWAFIKHLPCLKYCCRWSEYIYGHSRSKFQILCKETQVHDNWWYKKENPIRRHRESHRWAAGAAMVPGELSGKWGVQGECDGAYLEFQHLASGRTKVRTSRSNHTASSRSSSAAEIVVKTWYTMACLLKGMRRRKKGRRDGEKGRW